MKSVYCLPLRFNEVIIYLHVAGYMFPFWENHQTFSKSYLINL